MHRAPRSQCFFFYNSFQCRFDHCKLPLAASAVIANFMAREQTSASSVKNNAHVEPEEIANTAQCTGDLNLVDK